MLKNGRPYTNENGSIDDALISDRPLEEIDIVARWIDRNMEHGRKKMEGYSSYGLKHALQRDTGLYLTNNAFKDAMLLMGFDPIDPNVLNWEYRGVFKPDVNDNPNPFFKWAVKMYAEENSPRGDFVRDMRDDFSFPLMACVDIIRRYLDQNDACDRAVDVFESLWAEYEAQTKK